MPAPEAQQGVAVDADSLYAIASSGIARYDRKTRRRAGVGGFRRARVARTARARLPGRCYLFE